MDERRALTRRSVLSGLAAAAAVPAPIRAAPVGDPDLGPHVLIVDPAMPAAAIQARVDAIFREQERAHVVHRAYAAADGKR